MSPRRKSGLSPEDLQALKHLPAVLTALEHLQEQHAKVRALIRPGVLDEADRLKRLQRFTDGVLGPGVAEWAHKDGIHSGPGFPTLEEHRSAGAARVYEDKPRNPTLDTPERREYEEAKKAGRKVPVVDPFANASPAQRERMAEQRAIIDAERAARGMPARRAGPDFRAAPDPTPSDVVSDGDPETGLAVRTEELDTISDGSTPLADDADEEVH
jgi:hypothetical protein